MCISAYKHVRVLRGCVYLFMYAYACCKRMCVSPRVCKCVSEVDVCISALMHVCVLSGRVYLCVYACVWNVNLTFVFCLCTGLCICIYLCAFRNECVLLYAIRVCVYGHPYVYIRLCICVCVS